MTGRPAYPRRETLADIKALEARGLSKTAIAQQLGISRRTVYRILSERTR